MFGLLPVFLLAAVLVPVHLRVRTVLAGAALTTAEFRWGIIRLRWDFDLGQQTQVAIERLLSSATEKVPGPDAPAISRPRLWQRWGRLRLRGLLAAARCVAPHLRVQRLHVLAEIGTGDAAVTALTCGGLWSLLGQALGALGQVVHLPTQALQVRIRPQFGPPGMCGLADVALRVRPLHLLRAFRHLRAAGLRPPRRRARRR